MSKDSSLLIIYADAAGELPAGDIGALLHESTPQIIREGIHAAKEALLARHTPPKYIIIDIGSRHADVIEELDSLAEACEAGVRVVVTGKINDVSFYRSLIQRGIVEYFAYPIDTAQMVNALVDYSASPTLARNAKDTPQKNGFAIGFVSAARP